MRERSTARERPCSRCPFRRDVTPGEFSAERYADLAMCTVGGAGREKSPSDPMFACHKTVEGREQICAGWLAVAGWEHLRVRVMVLEGKVLGTALQPGPDWPELFDTYEEMAEVQGG